MECCKSSASKPPLVSLRFSELTTISTAVFTVFSTAKVGNLGMDVQAVPH